MLDRFDLGNKVILLTGGAGFCGRGLTADLTAANATLIIASRNYQNGEEVAKRERLAGRRVEAKILGGLFSNQPDDFWPNGKMLLEQRSVIPVGWGRAGG